MSAKTHNRFAKKVRGKAPLFAALGDENRLALLTKLGEGQSLSITQLCEGATISRQAITKHLLVLQDAGLIRGTRKGREKQFQLVSKPLKDATAALEAISRQWDDTLARLKSFVEQE